MNQLQSTSNRILRTIDAGLTKISRLKPSIKIAVSILFLVIFWFTYFQGIFLKDESFFLTFDNVEQFYPWYQKLSMSVHDGYIPLWDNNVFGGHSFVGEFQSGAMYIPNLVTVFLFGSSSGIDLIYLEILVALHFLWASIGMYLFSRSIKVSHLGSIAAGIVFTYLGATAARASAQSAIFFGLTYMPWVLLYINSYWETRKYRYLLIAGILLSLQIYSGHIQPFFHTVFLSGLWLLFFVAIDLGKHWKKRTAIIKKHILTLSAGLGIPTITATILTAPQLYLGLQYLNNANRWYGPDYVEPGEKIPYGIFGYLNILEPFEILNIADRKQFPIEDGNIIFLGFVPLLIIFFFVLIWFSSKKTTWFKKQLSEITTFVAGTSLLSYVIALGHFTFLSAILYLLPGFDRIRQPGRYVIILHFCLAVTIGLGIYIAQNYKLKLTQKHNLLLITISVFLLLQAIFLKFVLREEKISYEAFFQLLLVGALLLAVTFFQNYSKILTTSIVIILAIAIFNVHHFVIKDINDREGYPENFYEKDEVISYLEDYYGDYRVLSYDQALPKNIGNVYQIQTKLGHGASMYKQYYDFLSQNWSLDGEVNDLLNIRFVVSQEPLEDYALTLILEDEQSDRYLYERSTAYPRVYSREFAEGEEEIISNFKINEYSDHHMAYTVTLSRPGTVIFSEINYSGWELFVDGEKQPLNSANIKNYLPIFRSVQLDAGTYEISFQYKPFKYF